MGCRCSEIAICQNDLSILSSPISSALSRAASSNAPVSPSLGAGSQDLGTAIYFASLPQLQQLLSLANKKQDESIPRLQGRLGQETAKVSSMLSAFQAEDTAYHEEQARLAAAARSSGGSSSYRR